MPRMSRSGLAVLLLLVLVPALAAPPVRAGDWTRFRGPNGSGLTDAEGLPVEFGPESNVDWKTAVPFGRSSPVVGERQIFLTGIEGDKLVTVALDRGTGVMAWRAELDRGHTAELHRATDSSSPSPVTDGENVYAFFHEAGLVSYDATGKERWRRPLGPFRNYYSIAASPILAAGRLLMLCDQAEDSFLVAVDTETGEEIWRRKRPARLEAYTTPILLPDGSVLVAGSRWIDAYDPATGASRWSLGGFGTGPIASPVTDGKRLFLASVEMASEAPPPFSKLAGEHDADADGEISRRELEGSWMLEHFAWINNDGKGGISEQDWQNHNREVVNDNWGLVAVRLPTNGRKSEILWNYRKNVPYIPTPLVHGGVVYTVHNGFVTSLDAATGEKLKLGRMTSGSPKVDASPVAVDGKLFIAARDGVVAVLSVAADWRVLGLNDLGEEIYATPAVADNRLLVRTRGNLYAFAKPRAEPAAVAAAAAVER